MTRAVHSGVRSIDRSSSGFKVALDNGAILQVEGDMAALIGPSWTNHEATFVMDGATVVGASKGDRLPPICQCCSGEGRHAYRATARGVSPADDDTECTTCNESGRTYHRARPDSCGGAKAMHKGRRG